MVAACSIGLVLFVSIVLPVPITGPLSGAQPMDTLESRNVRRGRAGAVYGGGGEAVNPPRCRPTAP